MGPPKIKFLLDENVPIKLKRLFEKLGLACQTIQELGWCGLKDRKIAERLKAAQIVLLSRDKDFTFI